MVKKLFKRFARQAIKGVKPLVEAIPPMAIGLRAARDNFSLLKKTKMTPLGFKFCGNRLMEQGRFEEEEVEIVRRLLKGTDVFINVGANIGYYCCIALHQGIKTIAFEPVQANLRYLYRNIEINGWEDVEIFPVAVANKSGLINIFGGGTGASTVEGWAGNPLFTRRLVPSVRLDNLFADRFRGKRCFYVVDIEGAERFMLEGALRQMNQSPRPVWMMEITTTQYQPEGIRLNPNLMATFKIFWENGYTAWTADEAMRHVSEKDVRDVCNGVRESLHTNNFLFTENETRPEWI